MAMAMAGAQQGSWQPQTELPSTSGKAGKSSTGAAPAVLNLWQRERAQGGAAVLPLDPRKQKKLAKQSARETAGAAWFDLPAATMTPELRRELQLLRLRGVLDPKRHYKANDSKALPKFVQVGTVVEGPADFYSGRLTKKERRLTFADELLADSSLRSYAKRKYLEIQAQKEAGGKKFWKKKTNRRKASWAKS